MGNNCSLFACDNPMHCTVANNIMKMHGGRIGILSEGEGKGSTFLVDLPIFRSNPSLHMPHYSPRAKLENIPLSVNKFIYTPSFDFSCRIILIYYRSVKLIGKC